MIIQIKFTDEEAELLQSVAVTSGYRRAEPRKAWSNAERREAARYAIRHALGFDTKLAFREPPI